VNASPTFPCPFCGAPVHGAAAGVTTCMYCHAKVVAPNVHAMVTQESAAAYGAPPSRGPFADGIEGVVLAFDPQLGFVAIGAHSPHGEPPRLRAWDLVQGRVLWESLEAQTWVSSLTRASLRVHGRNVYVAHKRQLLALDLATGRRRWGAALSDAVDGDDVPQGGLAVEDPFPLHGRGAILVRTIDNGLFAFDRDTGQPLWNRSYGDKTFSLESVAGQGACLVRYGSPFVKIDIVNPAYAQPIASLGHAHWSTDLGLCRVFGRTVVTVVDDWGHEGDDDGLLVVDAVTGAVQAFEQLEDLEDDDILPCVMGPRIFVAADDGAAIYVGPRGRTVPCPVPGYAVAAFCAAGPTLGLLLKKAQGTPVRRLVGVDPATFAFRFDAGEAGTEPDDAFHEQLTSDGYSVVLVATPDDDRARSELRSFDTTTGRMLWSRAVGFWRAHAFVGGHLVAWSDANIEVLAPANGKLVGSVGAT